MKTKIQLLVISMALLLPNLNFAQYFQRTLLPAEDDRRICDYVMEKEERLGSNQLIFGSTIIDDNLDESGTRLLVALLNDDGTPNWSKEYYGAEITHLRMRDITTSNTTGDVKYWVLADGVLHGLNSILVFGLDINGTKLTQRIYQNFDASFQNAYANKIIVLNAPYQNQLYVVGYVSEDTRENLDASSDKQALVLSLHQDGSYNNATLYNTTQSGANDYDMAEDVVGYIDSSGNGQMDKYLISGSCNHGSTSTQAAFIMSINEKASSIYWYNNFNDNASPHYFCGVQAVVYPKTEPKIKFAINQEHQLYLIELDASGALNPTLTTTYTWTYHLPSTLSVNNPAMTLARTNHSTIDSVFMYIGGFESRSNGLGTGGFPYILKLSPSSHALLNHHIIDIPADNYAKPSNTLFGNYLGLIRVNMPFIYTPHALDIFTDESGIAFVSGTDIRSGGILFNPHIMKYDLNIGGVTCSPLEGILDQASTIDEYVNMTLTDFNRTPDSLYDEVYETSIELVEDLLCEEPPAFNKMNNKSEKSMLNDEGMSVSPNPFTESISIVYQLPQQSNVKISVMDLLGREIAIIENNTHLKAGTYTSKWDTNNELPTGTYFIRLETAEKVSVKKIIHSK